MIYREIRHRTVPALGLGTFRLSGDECRRMVEEALEIGYRHLDTAQMYGNEREVGKALAASGLARDEIWITTKIWFDELGREQVKRATDQRLELLGVDQLDLLLIHWPTPEVPLSETLAGMMEKVEQGLVREVGVSNFTPELVSEAKEHAPIFCNQVEYHPLLLQDELVTQAREREMLLTAYAPLAQGKVPSLVELSQIGQRYGKTGAQVALRWLVEQDNVAAIPKAASSEHLRDNFDIFDFELTDAERASISALDHNARQVDPGFAPRWNR